MRYRSLILPCRPVSLTEALTRTFFHTADPDHVETPMGLGFPVEAGDNGFTLTYYTRAIPNPGGRFSIYVDTSNGIQAALNSFAADGKFQNNLYVDGGRIGGPFTMYEAERWRLVVLLYEGAYPNGEIHLNHVVGETQRKYSYPRMDLAQICFYDRTLSVSEIAAAFMPSDYKQLYTAAGYQMGDVRIPERTGTGLDATFYY